MLGKISALWDMGDETAEVDDPTDAGVFGRGSEVAGRGAVGNAETRLTDAVHQVIDHVDRTGNSQARASRFGVGDVELHGRDVVDPPETAEPLGVATGGEHVMAGLEKCGDQPRSDVAGRARHKNSHSPQLRQCARASNTGVRFCQQQLGIR